MKVEKGVDITTVCPMLIKVLPLIDLIFYEKGNHLIITATPKPLLQFFLPIILSGKKTDS